VGKTTDLYNLTKLSKTFRIYSRYNWNIIPLWTERLSSRILTPRDFPSKAAMDIYRLWCCKWNTLNPKCFRELSAKYENNQVINILFVWKLSSREHIFRKNNSFLVWMYHKVGCVSKPQNEQLMLVEKVEMVLMVKPCVLVKLYKSVVLPTVLYTC
jgi:hypothetical protein